MTTKHWKKEQKRKYLNQQKEAQKLSQDAYIFCSLAGFADWGADLAEGECERYFCDTSSEEDIKRWFEEIIYPGYLQCYGDDESKLQKFVDLYDKGITHLLLGSSGMDEDAVLIGLEKNRDKFLRVIAGLVSEKLNQ